MLCGPLAAIISVRGEFEGHKASEGNRRPGVRFGDCPAITVTAHIPTGFQIIWRSGPQRLPCFPCV
jgi:hypothetical protein